MILALNDLNIYDFLKKIIEFISSIGTWVYNNVYLSLGVVLVVILAFLLVKILT